MDPSHPSERRTQVQPRALRILFVFAATLALLALSGCAAVPIAGTHASAETAESADPAESTALPSEPGDADATPPDSSAVPTPDAPTPRVLIVKASAYNSRRGQTDSTPSIGAWGDRLAPGMKVIAVSKDLFELGLRRGQRVRIAGLSGEFVVLDRMPSRWRQKIDIYMGHDVRAARQWGVRQVEISWIPEEETAIGAESAAGEDSDAAPAPSAAGNAVESD